ncbi:MAG: beta-lactamase family protein [Actinomycetota bacterium]|nr:beta-lactamase family protein [Actinomycetota bacterium]
MDRRSVAPPLRTPRALLGLVALVALVAGACTSDDAASGDTSTTAGSDEVVLDDELRDRLQELLTSELGTPGGVVSVHVGDDVWTGVTGDASIPTPTAEPAPGVEPVDRPVPVAEDMVWPLRSITKSFTVTLLLQLVDEGLVALDDTVEQYVPGLPNGDSITLEQLADMTSGLPEYTNQAWVEAFSADPLRDFSATELIGYAATEPAQFAPGEQHVYTNTNTVVLGQVIEAVTGTTFDEQLRTRILEPLELSRTVYPAGVDDWNGEHGTGYQMDDDVLTPQVVNFTVFDTAGAMISDVSDLAVWGKALATGSLVAEELHEVRTAAATPLDEGPEYDRYGLGIGEIDGWWGHTGEGMGFEALVMHDVERDLTVVVYVNMSNLTDSATGEPVHAPTALFRKIAALLDEG